jgi:predicted ATPase
MALLLNSLLIENYRVFKRLEIPRLGRVNLLVGQNNSGKTSLLEAISLYASGGSGEQILALLESHDDLRIETGRDLEDRFYAVKQLFHGRDFEWSERLTIRIGPLTDDEGTLSIRIAAVPSRLLGETLGAVVAPAALETDNGPRRPAVISTFRNAARLLPMDVTDWRTWSVFSSAPRVEVARHAYVSPHSLSSETASKLWDLIALTDLEQDVVNALRIISPDVERISFIGEAGRNRVPMAKLRGEMHPVALRSLGDGVNRLLGIGLSLVSARGGVLLLDEVENGIHFTAQRRLWELIFELAHRLDTQVFATTHSWDCIETFQRAAARDPHEEAALMRLDDTAITPTSFSERELAIVTREELEVR